ncbi:transporter substrate-binding domain-containing protein [Xanthomarina sp. GH4-25]|uniref:transporter substrate-binding domain-containing protein n=1 Tax=Xanthomarina sp. GH4-25 TaxID=3349335 RepID=UPI003877EF2D
MKHSRYLFRLISFITLTFMLLNQLTQAQDLSNKNISKAINVGVYMSPPFVIETDGELSGMSIELWENIAKQLSLSSNYKIYNNFHDLVLATSMDSVSIAVTNLTISKARAQVIDFTQPWYDAGLKVMISKKSISNSNDLLSGLRDAGHLSSYLTIGIIVLILTILMTIFDRKFDKEFSTSWRDGLAESFYQVMLMFTSGKLSRKNLFGWIGRIFSAIWLAVGVLVVAYVTSSITSVMTTMSLTNDINQLSDLHDKKIAVIEGSETEDYIRNKGFNYISFKNIDDMVDGLENNSVDAIVGDAPVLQYYKFTHQNKQLEVIGNLFEPDKYGFGLSPNNNYKKEITLEILKAHESGFIRKLKSNYFGQLE